MCRCASLTKGPKISPPNGDTGWKVKEAFHPVNPLRLKPRCVTQDKLLALLKKWTSIIAVVEASVETSVWASLRNSVGDSVWASVGDSVYGSVWDSVYSSVWASVEASVWASVYDSVYDSVGYSVWASVRASMGASVGAYIGGLFPNISSWKYAEELGSDPWRPLLTLWYAGYVPSFDGKTWRLHAGKNAKIVLEWTPEETNAESEVSE